LGGAEQMSAQGHRAEAARFIDKVIKLNQQHGADGDVTEDAYERAVRQVAAAFARLRPVQ
jgi:uncharacterized glyoxalase superfamily metalloenzyme YdcJ